MKLKKFIRGVNATSHFIGEGIIRMVDYIDKHTGLHEFIIDSDVKYSKKGKMSFVVTITIPVGNVRIGKNKNV